jgi:hypothetical protein
VAAAHQLIWGMTGYLANAGTTATSFLFSAIGYKPAGVNAVGRVTGKGGLGYGAELEVGAYLNRATVSYNAGVSRTNLTVTSIGQPGFRFDVGALVADSAGFVLPGTTIASVSPDPTNPSTITLSNPITQTSGSGSFSIAAQAVPGNTWGLLISGSGGNDSTTYAPSLSATVNGAQNPASGTLTVASTTNWPSSGTFVVGNYLYTYTGTTSTTFTGVQGYSQTLANGTVVTFTQPALTGAGNPDGLRDRRAGLHELRIHGRWGALLLQRP